MQVFAYGGGVRAGGTLRGQRYTLGIKSKGTLKGTSKGTPKGTLKETAVKGTLKETVIKEL